MTTLGLLHTSATLVDPFATLCRAWLPEVQTFNIVDDSLIKNTITAGRLTGRTAARVVDHIRSAEEAGADHVLATCSSIGPAVDAAAGLVEVPVLRVDRPMADRAVSMGRRIGVLATLRTTVEPTAALISRRAADAGREIELVTAVCDGAFEALMSGDGQGHDAQVAEQLRALAGAVDVVVLAQASMARIAEMLTTHERTAPVLASPPLAMEALAASLPRPREVSPA